MCPACAAAAATVALSATSGGGIVAVLFYRLRNWSKRWNFVPKGKEN